MQNRIKKTREELMAAYDIAHSNMISNPIIIRSLSNGQEDELNYEQTIDDFVQSYDSKDTFALRVIGNYHECKVTLYIHR